MRQFRKKGFDKVQQRIAGILEREGITAKSILEIDCGVGGLHQTLLRNGASTATGVDISEGMVEKARELASSAGLSNRVRYHVGDFVTSDREIPAADIVILDKVLRCYEDPGELIRKSVEKSNDLYAVSFPRGGLLGWIAVAPVSWLGRVLRSVAAATTMIWQVLVFRRG